MTENPAYVTPVAVEIGSPGWRYCPRVDQLPYTPRKRKLVTDVSVTETEDRAEEPAVGVDDELVAQLVARPRPRDCG